MSLCYTDVIVCTLSEREIAERAQRITHKSVERDTETVCGTIKRSGTLGRIWKSEIGLQMEKSERAIGRVKEETKDKMCFIFRLVALYFYSDPKIYFDA